MITILLVLVALIVLLQAGLMATLRKLVQQLDHARGRIAVLESRLDERVVLRDASAAAEAGVAPPPVVPAASRVASAPRTAHNSPRARAPTHGNAVPRDPGPPPLFDGADPNSDARALREEMISLMRQLVNQGLSVRDIAARCGLSEAEAELMLSLQGSRA